MVTSLSPCPYRPSGRDCPSVEAQGGDGQALGQGCPLSSPGCQSLRDAGSPGPAAWAAGARGPPVAGSAIGGLSLGVVPTASGSCRPKVKAEPGFPPVAQGQAATGQVRIGGPARRLGPTKQSNLKASVAR